MKIAFLVDQFPRLSETFILNQITGLIDRGHKVDIYAYGPANESQIHEDIKKYDLSSHTFYYRYSIPENKLLRFMKAAVLVGSNIHKNPVSLFRSLNIFQFGTEAASLRILYKVIPFLNRGRYDIIHCQFGPNGSLAVLLRSAGAIEGKVITTFHGYDIRLGLKKGGSIYERLFKEGDLFIAISEYNHRNLVKLGLNEEKIVYHPVGIDMKRFPFKWKGESAIVGKKVKIITIARLVEEKGLRFGIEAVHKLLLRRPNADIEYNIIGGGPLEKELTEFIKQLNMEKIVNLVGSRNQDYVIEALRQSHCFILPSIAEALPVVLMEAQAVGLPVIATTVGSVGQVVLDGISGFCVPAQDADALADRLVFLIDHPEVWTRMGQRGRKNIEDNYDIDKLNSRLVDIYRQLRSGCLEKGDVLNGV